ncbi:hypothetical protein M427DRAFT_338198 [Gonapodya prolifera JEL478]|uniref:Uncharacterized protein n=1 Tax=Gonapodya prolifera (strain JEL478) TaxID=1344416 RepID=A0A139ADL9_GONPJ|nr:hypothetical protein M427DRAFT_338198 [Gonapodya prolifera JEL478]|eukprot:KXS14513.1 hypothetical protein M427DRAFT_338198 [Gonapodya prolifera JEL478]
MADHAQPNPFFPPSQGQYRPVPSSAHDARAGGSSATLYGGEGGGAYADAGHKPEREVLMSSSVPHSVPQRHFDDEHGVDSAGHPASGRLVILRAVQLGLQSVVFVCLCVASTSPFVSLYSGFAWYWWTFVSTFLINIHIALFNGLPSYRGRVIAVFARGSGAAMFMWGPVVYDGECWSGGGGIERGLSAARRCPRTLSRSEPEA